MLNCAAGDDEVSGCSVVFRRLPGRGVQVLAGLCHEELVTCRDALLCRETTRTMIIYFIVFSFPSLSAHLAVPEPCQCCVASISYKNLKDANKHFPVVNAKLTV